MDLYLAGRPRGSPSQGQADHPQGGRRQGRRHPGELLPGQHLRQRGRYRRCGQGGQKGGCGDRLPRRGTLLRNPGQHRRSDPAPVAARSGPGAAKERQAGRPGAGGGAAAHHPPDRGKIRGCPARLAAGDGGGARHRRCALWRRQSFGQAAGHLSTLAQRSGALRSRLGGKRRRHQHLQSPVAVRLRSELYHLRLQRSQTGQEQRRPG